MSNVGKGATISWIILRVIGHAGYGRVGLSRCRTNLCLCSVSFFLFVRMLRYGPDHDSNFVLPQCCGTDSRFASKAVFRLCDALEVVHADQSDRNMKLVAAQTVARLCKHVGNSGDGHLVSDAFLYKSILYLFSFYAVTQQLLKLISTRSLWYL